MSSKKRATKSKPKTCNQIGGKRRKNYNKSRKQSGRGQKWKPRGKRNTYKKQKGGWLPPEWFFD